MFYLIYKTTNLINNKIYVGKHVQYDTSAFDGYLGSGLLIKRAISKHGEENFQRDLIEVTYNINILNEREIYWIEQLSACDKNIGYNLTKGGQGGDTISNHPNKLEIYRKISLSSKINTKKYWDELTKEEYKTRCESQQKDKNGMFGKVGYWKDKEIPRIFVEKMIKTKEERGILRQYGHENPNYDNHWDEEQKEKASQIWKEKYENGYVHPQTGIPLSEEVRKKLSQARIGKYKGHENPFFNQHHTEETLKILSEKAKTRGYRGNRNKKCEIDGMIYNSLSEAAKSLNVVQGTILWRIKSKNPKFAGYKYL